MSALNSVRSMNALPFTGSTFVNTADAGLNGIDHKKPI